MASSARNVYHTALLKEHMLCYLMASSIDRAGKNEDDEEGYVAGVGDAQEAPTLKGWEQVALRHAAADDGLGGGDVF
jgi:hypothetical protein